MVVTETGSIHKLLFILHRGLTEARLLALDGRSQQLFDLTDALDGLPGFIDQWNDEHWEAVRFNLQTYQDKYHGKCFDYLSHLNDNGFVPERF